MNERLGGHISISYPQSRALGTGSLVERANLAKIHKEIGIIVNH